jgi:TRAP-type transport system small permease protein
MKRRSFIKKAGGAAARQGINPFSRMSCFDKITDFILTCLLATMVCIVLLSVFFRYVLNDSLFWSDELVRYVFVWFTMIGAAVVLREREHIRIEYFVEKLPERTRRMIEAAVLAGVCLLQSAFAILGFLWVWSTRGTSTSALQWPLNIFFYAAVPISSVIAWYYSLNRLRKGAFTEKAPAESEAPPPDVGGKTV